LNQDFFVLRPDKRPKSSQSQVQGQSQSQRQKSEGAPA